MSPGKRFLSILTHGGWKMNSSLIGKIEKAQRYEQEPERVTITQLQADFRGEHDVYHLSLDGEHWKCSCSFYHGYGTCSHVMAVQRILAKMLSMGSRSESPLEHVGMGATE
jgi:hypothetical protein